MVLGLVIFINYIIITYKQLTMPAYPFTPAGVTSKTVDLYALDDSDLLTEARSLTTDFYAWLNANFTLTTRQQNYISAAPDMVKFNWGVIIAAAILQRAVIQMASVPASYGPPRRTKEVITSFNGTNKFFPPVVGPSVATGTVTLAVDYVLVD